MKKYISTFLMVAMMAVMVPLAATDASAQTDCYYDRYGQRICREYDEPNVYDKHRNIINIGIGAGAGALLGALFGGKKGALIGAAAGAGGGALYTYVFNKKTKRYERRYVRR